MTDEEHTERAALQRRIRNQRRELCRLNVRIGVLNRSREYWMQQAGVKRSECYRHAAEIAEQFLFGRRIAQVIRRWV